MEKNASVVSFENNQKAILLDNDSYILSNIDHLVLVLKHTCRIKKKKGDFSFELICPLFSVCNKKKCLIVEEFVKIKEDLEK